MNCRDIESLLLAERDGGWTTAQRASVEEHVATCTICRQARTTLTATVEFMQHDAANVTVPNIEAEWRTLRAELHSTQTTTEKKRPLAPIIRFGAPLAAAAAIALVFLLNRLPAPGTGGLAPVSEVASAEYVEAGDADASTMVYVDKDSGWLVVWASDSGNVQSG